MLKKVQLDVNPATHVKDLGVGKQQLIEIAKALSKDVKLMILDEPTAALYEDDSLNLLNLLRGMNLMNTDISLQYLARGTVLALAVIFDVATRNRGK